MPYIGNPIYQSAFVTDTFSGNGSTTAFTMSVAPAGTTSVLVAISGVLQDPATYGVVGTTLTFSSAPPSGTGNISARYLGIPASGVTTTAYRTVTEFTATANQTTFTPPSYTVGFINVYRNGVLLGSADYTATNGTTVVLTTGATSGDLVTVESFLVSSVLNALPLSGGNLSGNLNLTAGNLGFTGTAQRITGDFSNLTSNNRVAFQTSTANSYTQVGVLPNGTSAIAQFDVLGSSDATNASRFSFRIDGASDASIRAAREGTGTYLPLTMYTGGSERLRIDTSGNVGIGTAAPGSNLEVSNSGNTRIFATSTGTSNTFPGFIVKAGTQSNFQLVQNSGNGEAYIYNSANAPMTFATNNTERMRIDSDGNLLIGTTSSNGKLSVVQGAANQTGGYIQSNGLSTTLRLNNTDTAAGNHTLLYGTANGADKLYVLGTGSLNNATGVYSAFSDRRLKENIVDATPKLDKLLALRVVNFNMKETPDLKQIGFVADEVEKVSPGLVDEFVSPKDGKTYQSIKISVITPMLVKAIQELKAELDATKAEVAALKAGK